MHTFNEIFWNNLKLFHPWIAMLTAFKVFEYPTDPAFQHRAFSRALLCFIEFILILGTCNIFYCSELSGAGNVVGAYLKIYLTMMLVIMPMCMLRFLYFKAILSDSEFNEVVASAQGNDCHKVGYRFFCHSRMCCSRCVAFLITVLWLGEGMILFLILCGAFGDDGYCTQGEKAGNSFLALFLQYFVANVIMCLPYWRRYTGCLEFLGPGAVVLGYLFVLCCGTKHANQLEEENYQKCIEMSSTSKV